VAEAFEAQRDRLRAVAYRVLGSHADAEEVVQEAWMRLARSRETRINAPAGPCVSHPHEAQAKSDATR
jgi:DNA-directed RNA polymerase specialized sigma24 family protein